MKSLRIFRALAVLTALLVLAGLWPVSSTPTFAAPDAPGAYPYSLAFSAGPSYDTGWVNIAAGATLTFTHNLGGTTLDLLVDLQARTFSSAAGVNNRFTGGIDFGASPYAGSAGDRMGVFWHNLSTTHIKVTRQAEDTLVNQVRIRIWRTSEVDYSSGWVSIGLAGTLNLSVYLNKSALDYVVDLMFYDADDGWGVNQRANGGRDLGARSGHNDSRVGAFWYGLTDYAIHVYRYAEDFLADQVLVRIWYRPRPTYDSGWITLAPGETRTLSHDIRGAPDDMLVDLQYRSLANPAYGVSNAYWGGNDFGATPPVGMAENDRVGAYWYGLTSSSVAIVRREEDIYAGQVRVRIWHFWTPTRPGYDSGWRALSKNTTLNLLHGMRNTYHDYMVDMQFKSTIISYFGINNMAYGGMDGNGSSMRYGAYWYDLDVSDVSVRRREDDIYVDQVRLRIWDMPKAAYDSNFTGIAPGQTLTFTHNLNGQPTDYLVDFQYFKNSDLTYGHYHQIAYGILDLGPADSNDNKRMGAAWHNLTSNTIQVTRGGEDIYLDSVRVRIWLVSQPTFHSGWVGMPLDSPQTISHFLGQTPEDYFVNVMFNGSALISQMYYGTNVLGAYSGGVEFAHVGAYWRDLTNNHITLYRADYDTYAQYMQARIWLIPKQIFLPLIKK